MDEDLLIGSNISVLALQLVRLDRVFVENPLLLGGGVAVDDLLDEVADAAIGALRAICAICAAICARPDACGKGSASSKS